MKGVDSLALIIECHEKYGIEDNKPKTLNEYITKELDLLSMQIENLRRKVNYMLKKNQLYVKEKENKKTWN